MAVTLRNVAEKAGVSIGTASHILNGKDREIRISAATRKRVIEVARKLNYKPNSFARSLRTRKSNTIGVCAAYLMDQYTATILQYVSHSAHDKGYRLMLSFLEEQESPSQAIHESFGNGTVDGILVRESSDILDDDTIIKLHEEGIKIVLVGREIEGSSIPSVLYDNFQGGFMAAEHLLSMGHEKISVVMNDETVGIRRAKGACAALENHVKPEVLFININSPEEISKLGYEYGIKIAGMQKQDRPTAIVAYDDILAFGIILAVKSHGLRVPEDIAVVGFDDMVSISEYYDPPLTSIRPPYAELGQTAVSLLVDLIEEKIDPEDDTRIMLNPLLIARKSSGVSVE